jgi:enoyl-CoA hydratase/carnithine racemase
MANDCLLIERPCDGVTVLRLNRPESLNALDQELLGRLHDAVDAASDDLTCTVVVLAGEGPGFCAGLDLHEAHTPLPGTEDQPEVVQQMLLQKRFTDLFEKIHGSPKVFIAAVGGPAVGGGFALALACDIRVVSPEARFGAVFIKLGVVNTDLGISYMLPRCVGAARSAEMLLTGRLVAGEEAERIGLVTHLLDPNGLLDGAVGLASEIANAGAFQLWMTKETMWQTLDAPSYRHAIDMENRTQIMASLSGEVKEAFAAFQNGAVERRAPQ